LNRQEIIVVGNKEKISLKGTKIGEIVLYKKRLYYLTHRHPEHFMRKWQSFGIDKGILEKVLNEEINYKRMLRDPKFILFIIFFYIGEREQRYYIIDPMKIQEEGIIDTFTKDTGNSIETYGTQYFYPLHKMAILGYDKEDYEIRKREKKIVAWQSWS
jgi:hypothetical protein